MQSNVNQEGKERMMADGGEGRRGRGRGGCLRTGESQKARKAEGKGVHRLTVES